MKDEMAPAVSAMDRSAAELSSTVPENVFWYLGMGAVCHVVCRKVQP
jgi:hypothetical protein